MRPLTHAAPIRKLGILKNITGAFARGAALLIPYECPGCGKLSDRFICPDCEKRVGRIAEPYCKVCGRQLPTGVRDTSDCRECRDAKIPFDLCRSFFLYSPPVNELVKRFKFRRNYTAGRWLVENAIASLAGNSDYLPDYGGADFLAPVPLHPIRRVSRGFNQSDYIAEGFGRYWDIKVSNCLARRRHTRPQSLLPLKERVKNVKGAFAVRKNADVKGRKIILVDDVMTSGATVRECSRILKAAGADKVYILTIARRS